MWGPWLNFHWPVGFASSTSLRPVGRGGWVKPAAYVRGSRSWHVAASFPPAPSQRAWVTHLRGLVSRVMMRSPRSTEEMKDSALFTWTRARLRCVLPTCIFRRRLNVPAPGPFPDFPQLWFLVLQILHDLVSVSLMTFSRLTFYYDYARDVLFSVFRPEGKFCVIYFGTRKQLILYFMCNGFSSGICGMTQWVSMIYLNCEAELSFKMNSMRYYQNLKIIISSDIQMQA